MKKNFQIIIPAAGPNIEFEKFSNHKLLIKINNKTLIEWVQQSRPYDLSNGIFIFQKKHQTKYNIVGKIQKIFKKKIKYHLLEKLTNGAPQSIIQIRKSINLNKPLFIDLLDQYIDFKKFLSFCLNSEIDGVVPLFQSLYFNRGYAINDKKNNIKKISEKDKIPISTNSTGCVSYFKKASYFFDNAELMINKRKKSANGKYMVSLVYNEMIKKKYIIKGYNCDFIASLGSVNSIKSFYENCRMIDY